MRSNGNNMSIRDVFSTLPPELLAKIYLQGDPLLTPTAVGISRVHRPYATENAYKHILITGEDVDVTLAAFGQTMRKYPHLGELVERFEVREERTREKEYSDGQAGWLEGSFVDAFDGLVNVQTVVVYRKFIDDILTKRIMEAKAWDSARKLIVHSSDPIPYASLAHVHGARSLRELEIRSPMQRLIGRPSGLFLPSNSLINTLHIYAEPHTSEFSSFFSHLTSLTHLHLRSGSTDLSAIARSLSPETRSTLQSLSFSAVGYHNLNIDAAFLGFDSLQHLDLWTPFEVSPSFLSSLALLPLISVVLHGPRNPYLIHIIDFFQRGEAPPSLDHWGLDFTHSPAGQGRNCTPTELGSQVGSNGEKGRDGGVRELVDACARCGVTLMGSIRDGVEPFDRF